MTDMNPKYLRAKKKIIPWSIEYFTARGNVHFSGWRFWSYMTSAATWWYDYVTSASWWRLHVTSTCRWPYVTSARWWYRMASCSGWWAVMIRSGCLPRELLVLPATWIPRFGGFYVDYAWARSHFWTPKFRIGKKYITNYYDHAIIELFVIWHRLRLNVFKKCYFTVACL